jgi:hypothetical protein
MINYINAPEMGPLGKADILMEKYGAEHTNAIIPQDSSKVLVCVVNNGPFEAAGIIDNEDELNRWLDFQDARPKVWLKMEKEQAFKLV